MASKLVVLAIVCVVVVVDVVLARGCCETLAGGGDGEKVESL